MNPLFKINGIPYLVWLKINHDNDLFESISFFVAEWLSSKNTFIFHTSGSTGKPKPIKVQRKYLEYSARATGKFFNLQEGNSVFLCLPVEFIAGRMMLVRAMMLGLDLHISKPQVNAIIKQTFKFQFCAMTPLQVSKILKIKPDFLNTIDTLIIGGGKISNVLEKNLAEMKTNCFATYGMTETLSHIALKNITNSSVSFFTALPEVRFSSNKNMQLIIDAPNWGVHNLLTNDVVNLVSEFEFEWLGRMDGVINTGSYKIFPEKIEDKLELKIDSPFFISKLPDKVLGDKVILVVQGTEQNIDLDELANYEKPKYTYFLPKFIYTETGKVNRNKTMKLL